MPNGLSLGLQMDNDAGGDQQFCLLSADRCTVQYHISGACKLVACKLLGLVERDVVSGVCEPPLFGGAVFILAGILLNEGASD